MKSLFAQLLRYLATYENVCSRRPPVVAARHHCRLTLQNLEERVVPSGETVTLTYPSVPNGKTVVVTFDAFVNNPLTKGIDRVFNEGTVTGFNFAPVNTDDPNLPGLADVLATPVNHPPQVAAVFVSGTAWQPAYYQALVAQGLGDTTYGYAIPSGSAQLTALPWTNLNRVSVRFNDNVNVTADDLTVFGVNVSTYVLNPALFSYDQTTFTATWVLSSPVAPDNLRLVLDGSAATGVISAIDAAALDGEWNDGDTPTPPGPATFPSGNGVPGGDFTFRITAVPGDADGNAATNISDVQQIRSSIGGSGNALLTRRDVNGDGAVNTSDVQAARFRIVNTAPDTLPGGPSGGGWTPSATPTPPDSPGGAGSSTTVSALNSAILLTDVNFNGRVDPGDILRYVVRITINLGTPATNLTLTDRLDPNVSLLPGSINGSPLAVSDAYTMQSGTTLVVSAANGLLVNDADPNTSPPNGSLQVIGATTTGPGEQLTVNPDGGFSFTPGLGFKGTTTFTYTITDPFGLTDVGSVTITVTNSPPIVGNTEPSILTHGESDPAVRISPSISVTDVDDPNLTGATVQIVSGYVFGQDVLGLSPNPLNGIFSSFNPFTATLTLSGTAPRITYEIALRLVTFGIAGQGASGATAGLRQIVFQVTDPANTSSPITFGSTRFVNVVPSADPPTISVGSPFNPPSNTTATLEDTATTLLFLNPAAADGTPGPNYRFQLSQISNGTLLFANGTPIPIIGGVAYLSVPLAQAGIRFQPAPDLNSVTSPQGSAFSFIVRASLDPNGNGLSAAQPFTVVPVTSVNDTPVRTGGAVSPLTVMERSGTTSLGLGGVTYAAGPTAATDEVFQFLTYSVTTVPSFTLGTVRSGGTVLGPGSQLSAFQLQGLTFTTDQSGSGFGTFAYVVTDNGQTNGFNDPRSLPQSLQITVIGVNDGPPTAGNDFYSGAIGNTRFEVGGPTGPGPVVHVAGNVLTNDFDTESPAGNLTASAGSTSANGGSVAMSSNGTFVYVPPAGFTGTDSFTYTVSDNDPTGNLSSTATVFINVSNRVWYVNSAAGSGDGRSTSPFNSLAAFGAINDGAAGHPGDGDSVYLHTGNGLYDGGITLRNGQALIGAGTAFTLGGLSIAAGTRPVIVNSASGGNGITLAFGNTIRGFDVGNTGGTDIVGTSFGTLTISNVALTGTGRALALTSGTLAVNLDSVISNSSAGGPVVALSDVGGTLTTGLTSIAGASAGGIAITFAPAGTFYSFGNANVTASGAAAVSVSGNNASATTSFTSLVAAGSGTTGLFANNGGTLSIAGSANAVSSTGGPAVDLTTTIISGGVTFGQVSSINSPTTGISLTNFLGAVTANGGTISGAAGGAFRVSGLATATYGGIITQNANAPLLSVTDHTGTLLFQTGTLTATAGTGLQFTNADGSYTFTGPTNLIGGDAGIDVVGGSDVANGSQGTFSFGTGSNITNPVNEAVVVRNSRPNFTYAGSLTKTNSAMTGILVQNNPSGTIAFSGPAKTLSTGTATAINVSGNTGAAINFTGGSLAITTTTGTGFTATGGGSVTVTGSANTIAANGSGTALNVVGTAIGSSGLTFRSISAGTATASAGAGIILDSTGFLAGLTVTGTGTAGTGGTIQQKTGADGAADHSGIGIYLRSTAIPSFSWMRLNDFSNFAIFGTGVSGFTLRDSVITGANGTNEDTAFLEGSIVLNELTGTAVVTRATISGGKTDNLRVENSAGTLTSLTVSESTIQNNSTTTGAGGFQTLAQGSAAMTVSVTDTTFQGNRTVALRSGAAGSGTLDFTATGNTIVAGTAGNNKGQRGIELSAVGAGQVTFLVDDNLIGVTDDAMTNKRPLSSTGITVSGASTTIANLSGKVSNNKVQNDDAVATGVNNGFGIRVSNTDRASIQANLTGNTIRGVSIDNGILAQSSGTASAPAAGRGVLTIGVTNNNADVLSNASDAIRLEALNFNRIAARINTNVTDAGGTGFFGLFVRQVNSAAFQIEGLATGARNAATTRTYLLGQNPGAATVGASAATSFTGVTSVPGIPPMLAAPGGVEPTTPHRDAGAPLTLATLGPITAAAVARWAATGLTAAQLAALEGVDYAVRDLPAAYLGTAPIYGTTVTLDVDAAGYGWFVDPTPADDAEFGRAVSTTRRYTDPTEAPAGRMDLLTVVMHELGHVMGLGSSFEATDRDELMYAYLTTGERFLPSSAAFDAPAMQQPRAVTDAPADRRATDTKAARDGLASVTNRADDRGAANWWEIASQLRRVKRRPTFTPDLDSAVSE